MNHMNTEVSDIYHKHPWVFHRVMSEATVILGKASHTAIEDGRVDPTCRDFFMAKVTL